MKKGIAFLFSFLFFLSCSFVDEAKALTFHNDCYRTFKNYLKDNPSEKMNQAYVETPDAKSIYRFTFDDKTVLRSDKTQYKGVITLSFYKNDKDQLRMEYLAEMTTVVQSSLPSVSETEEMISRCLVNQTGTVLDGICQVRRSTATTQIGYTNIANLEGYLIIFPFEADYSLIKQ